MDIFSSLQKDLSGKVLDTLSAGLGTDSKTTQSVMVTALPVLVKALSNNTSDKNGMESLFDALMKDHDGSVLEKPEVIVDEQVDTKGTNILGHILGNKNTAVTDMIAKTVGVDRSLAGKMMEMLAPAVMGSLGKYTRDQGLDASSLASALKKGTNKISENSTLNTLLTSLLDKDGDGSIQDDLLDMGMKYLKKLF